MSLSFRGATAVRATQAKSLHRWCVLVSVVAELIPALATLADLLLHLSPQIHLGRGNIYAANVYSQLP